MKPFKKNAGTYFFQLAIFVILMSVTGNRIYAQSMGISSSAITPDASSILEMRTTSKGMLIPRMTTTQRDAIPSPATGLMIYNTTTNNFNFYNGSSWTAISSGTNGVNSVSGTTNRISIGGTSADPTVDISSAYVGQNSITTLGTIGTGTWNGSTIGIAYGGTGQITQQAAINALTGTQTAGTYLRSNGTNAILSAIQAADVPTLNQNTTGSAATLTTSRNIHGGSFNGSADVTNIISSTYGGTGNGFTKFTGPATAEKTFTLPDASATILTSNAAVTVAQGGTGQTSYTDGQLLIGNTTGNTLTKSTLAAGTGISVTNGGGSITITNTSPSSGGTVTSVAALTLGTTGTDLSSSVATGTTTPVITLNVPTASAANRGALSSADWSTFNGKESALTFSTGLTRSTNTVTVNTSQNINTLSNLTSNGLIKTSGGTGALSIATSGTDYSAGTSALATGILKSTTTTGALSIAVAGDFPTLNQNTTGSAATLTTARNIHGGSFNGSADVTNIITSTYGGTGNGFTKFTGPATAEKTFTLPDASATILTSNAAVTVAQGGTGTSTAFTQGSLVFAGGSGVYNQNNSKLFWDNTNFRVGIGTASPNTALQVGPIGTGTENILIGGTSSAGYMLNTQGTGDFGTFYSEATNTVGIGFTTAIAVPSRSVFKVNKTGMATFGTSVSTDDNIILQPFTGGSNSFAGIITTNDLTAARTYTLPDASGTLALTSSNISVATGTTGTDVGVTGSPVSLGGTITLNIPIASATNTGKLSSTDWTTFNNKASTANPTFTGIGTFNSINIGLQSIATAAGTTTLTSSSPYHTIFTGSSTQTIVLPNATTLAIGQRYKVSNNSTGLVTVQLNGGSVYWILGASTDLDLALTDNGTAAGTWEKDYRVGNNASGKVATFNSTSTFSATDGVTYTFPSVNSSLAPLVSPSFTTPTLGVASATSVTLTGTAGSGYIELQSQSSAPATGPTNSVRLFSNGGNLAWKRSDGFLRSFNSTFTADHTYTLPDADGTLAVSASGNIALSSLGNISFTGALPVANGGTNLTSYTTGDLLYASGTTTLSKLAGVATGNALISGGVGVAPSWGKIGLTTHVSGVLPIANGGTNSTASPTNGGVAYGNGSAYQFTAAGTTGQVLQSAGAAAPVWVDGGTMMFSGNTAGSTVNNQTRYFPLNGIIGGSGTDDLGQRNIVSRSGTIKSLYVRLSVALAAGKTGTVTVFKNGVATSLNVTLSVGPVLFSDTTDSFTVSAGDEIGVQVTTTGTAMFSWAATFIY